MDAPRPADYWRRVVAAIVDFIVVGIAAALLFALVLVPFD